MSDTCGCIFSDCLCGLFTLCCLVSRTTFLLLKHDWIYTAGNTVISASMLYWQAERLRLQTLPWFCKGNTDENNSQFVISRRKDTRRDSSRKCTPCCHLPALSHNRNVGWRAFGDIKPEISIALREQNPQKAYFLMHEVLGEVWKEIYRVLKSGGLACINMLSFAHT